MKRLLWLCVGMTLVLALSVLATRVVGERFYRPPMLLAGLGSCATPCWNGIVLGESSLTDASAVLNARGFSAVGSTDQNDLTFRLGGRDCWATATFFGNHVTTLRFSGCEVIAVGDLMLALGAPSSLIATGGVGDWLRWQDNLIEAGITGTASIRLPIDSLGLDAPSGSLPSGTPWHGFVPFWRYCQLEQVLYYCLGAALNAPP